MAVRFTSFENESHHVLTDCLSRMRVFTEIGTLRGFRASRDELRPAKPAFARRDH